MTTETRRQQSTSNFPDSYWIHPVQTETPPVESKAKLPVNHLGVPAGTTDLAVSVSSASADSKPLDSAYGRWYASKKVGNRRIETCDGGVTCSVNGASCQTILGWTFIKGRDGLTPTPFDVFTAKDGTHCNLTLEQTKAKLLETGQTASLLNLNMFTEEILGLPAMTEKKPDQVQLWKAPPDRASIWDGAFTSGDITWRHYVDNKDPRFVLFTNRDGSQVLSASELQKELHSLKSVVGYQQTANSAYDALKQVL